MIWNSVYYWWNKLLKCFIMCLVYFSLASLAYIMYKTSLDASILTKDKYAIYVASFMGIGILIAYRQIVSSNDLARRQLSSTESFNILKIVRENRQALEVFEKMDYAQELQEQHAIKHQDIHNWICKKDSDNKFIGEPGKYELTEEGKQIRILLRDTINVYEYMAVGVINGSFDENIMRDTIKSMTINTYNSFSDYIRHIRETEPIKGFAENFEWIADKWKKKKIIPVRDK